ncbi:MAG TPA: hypothetical protein PK915_09520 [Bacteroidales bacterium]|nr:hypothetical protein [Bacteroidales bacterium]
MNQQVLDEKDDIKAEIEKICRKPIKTRYAAPPDPLKKPIALKCFKKIVRRLAPLGEGGAVAIFKKHISKS